MFKFDTHMHFDLYNDKELVLAQIERYRSYTIAVTNLPTLYLQYKHHIEWEKFKYSRLALGFHPELITLYSKQIDSFISLLPNSRYIGEVGLDFSVKDQTIRWRQTEFFKRIVDECSKFGNKILTIHTRKAVRETLDIMKEYRGVAIFHWFSGTLKDLQEALKHGYYFSINHQMLKSSNGKRIVDSLPLNRMLIESDAPFTYGLGKRYSILFIDEIYQYLEKTRNIDEQTLSNIFLANFKNILS